MSLWGVMDLRNSVLNELEETHGCHEVTHGKVGVSFIRAVVLYLGCSYFWRLSYLGVVLFGSVLLSFIERSGPFI